MVDESDASSDEIEATPAPQTPPASTPAKALLDALSKTQSLPRPTWKTTSIVGRPVSASAASQLTAMTTGTERRVGRGSSGCCGRNFAQASIERLGGESRYEEGEAD